MSETVFAKLWFLYLYVADLEHHCDKCFLRGVHYFYIIRENLLLQTIQYSSVYLYWNKIFAQNFSLICWL